VTVAHNPQIDSYATHTEIIAIVGLSKNAGKTTFLNWYLHSMPDKSKPVGVTTTGRDGEDIDLLTTQKKPKVELPENTFFTSFTQVAQTHQSQIEVVTKLPFRVIGHHLWLYKAISPISTEVVGPATLSEQEALISLFADLHCRTILIDGSIDRKSIGLSEYITQIALVIGAAGGNIDVLTTTANIYRLYNQIPHKDIAKYENITYCANDTIIDTGIKSIYTKETLILDILSKDTSWIYFPGAITPPSWQKLKKAFVDFSGDIVFKSPLNINILPDDLETLANSHNLYTRTPFPLKMVAVNSFSPSNEHIDAGELKKQVERVFPFVEVVDVRELGVRS